MSAFRIHTDNVLHLVADPADSRRLMLDVEQRPATLIPASTMERPADTFALVMRGWDKVRVGAKESTATDASDRAEHKPALVWNDESGAARAFLLAEFDDKNRAETVLAQLLDFYDDAPESPEFDADGKELDRSGKIGARRILVDAAYAEKVQSLCPESRRVLVALIPTFGKQRGTSCAVGSFNGWTETPRATRATPALAQARKDKIDAENRAAAAEKRMSELLALVEQLSAQRAGQNATPAAAAVDGFLASL